ncbi:uncharacterized protein LOC136077028 isoform X1 [Hydra vulgaris]|uniref:Uncharacterized protein LOC136077028 isoform X1 n=1 Tax=Hydra vulgaris TaxID=6087 RepID=A0ABM4BEM7_HYDVU
MAKGIRVNKMKKGSQKQFHKIQRVKKKHFKSMAKKVNILECATENKLSDQLTRGSKGNHVKLTVQQKKAKKKMNKKLAKIARKASMDICLSEIPSSECKEEEKMIVE